MKIPFVAAALALVAAGCSCPECGKGPAPAEPAPTAAPAAPVPGEIRFVTPSKDYPLKECVVSGEALDEMGEPVAIVYEGTEVQFCCRHCLKDFKQDPEKYLSMVRSARK